VPIETESQEIKTDIILIDIISFSKLQSDQQLELITFLTKSFTKMIETMLKNSNMSLQTLILGYISTGDGFFSILNPRFKGFGTLLGLSFNHFSDLVATKFPYFKGIRIAVHHGKLFHYTDLLGNPNYIGDGINECARYLEFKHYTISTVIISLEANETFLKFCDVYKDFNDLLHAHQFKRSRLYSFRDKHNIERKGYMVWLRKGGIINPPNMKYNSLIDE